MNNFDLRKFLKENRDTKSTKLLSEVEFTKKERYSKLSYSGIKKIFFGCNKIPKMTTKYIRRKKDLCYSSQVFEK